MTPIRWFFSFIFWNFFQGSFLWHRIFCLIKILLIWCIKAHLFPSVWVLECILTNNSVILASHRVISYCSDAITISQHQRQPNWRKMQQHFQAHFQTGLNCLQILHFYLLFNKEIQCRDFFSSLSPARRWKQRTIKFISRLGSDKIIKWLLRRWDSVLSSFIFLSDRKNETHGALALYPCPINPTWKMWGGWGKKGKIQKGARSFLSLTRLFWKLDEHLLMTEHFTESQTCIVSLHVFSSKQFTAAQKWMICCTIRL